MENFLKELRYRFIPINQDYDFFSRKNRIYLISDSYGSHDCESSEYYAMSLNIDIITIPKGLTSKYQPLDVGVNAIIKEEQKSFINHEAIDEIMNLFDSQKGQFKDQIPILKAISKQVASNVLFCIWENISSYDIQSAFDDSLFQYFDDVDLKDNFSEDENFEKRLHQFNFTKIN